MSERKLKKAREEFRERRALSARELGTALSEGSQLGVGYLFERFESDDRHRIK
jgi:hypothetical protein